MGPGYSNSKLILPWRLLASKELFTSKRLQLKQDTCELPNQRVVNDYLVLTMPDGAAIVAITLKQELVLVKQYKHGLGQIVLELPAGNVESNEDPWHTIARELVEETGYEASSVELISILATKPARMSARTFIYFARDVKFTGRQQNDDAEVIEVVLIPLKDIPTLLREGKIITETSLAAIMMAWDRLIPLL